MAEMMEHQLYKSFILEIKDSYSVSITINNRQLFTQNCGLSVALVLIWAVSKSCVIRNTLTVVLVIRYKLLATEITVKNYSGGLYTLFIRERDENNIGQLFEYSKNYFINQGKHLNKIKSLIALTF